jgi:hypothetical protein
MNDVNGNCISAGDTVSVDGDESYIIDVEEACYRLGMWAVENNYNFYSLQDIITLRGIKIIKKKYKGEII